MKKIVFILFVMLLFIISCNKREKITDLNQLAEKEFAVPTGTIADKLVQSKFPDTSFKYFNTVLDACMAVKTGKADAAAYDEPILKNIAAKVEGLTVLPDMITIDEYGFAVDKENVELKKVIDEVVASLNADGSYNDMMKRWLPEQGAPADMPQFDYSGTDGILRFGTSAVTEPFSFIDGKQNVVGLDIEIASLVAKKMNMKLEIVNMDFGAMIPAVLSKKVDFIGACITISEERKQKVLFSEPYYKGGIAALVAE